MPKPKISILMPIYNAERYIEDALQSILGQHYTDWDCILVDDGSTDGTVPKIKLLITGHKNIKLIEKEQSGIVDALNVGLEHCTGIWVARMDADDIAHPERLGKQLDFLEKNEACIACGTNALMIDPAGYRIRPVNPPLAHEDIVQALMQGRGTSIIHPSLMIKREVLNTLNGYRKEYERVEDLDLYLRAKDMGVLANLDEVLLQYRQHPSSSNIVHKKVQRDLRKRLIEERGLPMPTHLLEPLGEESLNTVDTTQRCYVDWAYKSVIGGLPGSALHFMLKAIRLKPWSAFVWLECMRILGFSLKRRKSK